MRVTFVHRHGPGQFGHLIARLAGAGHRVTFLCEKQAEPIPGARILTHEPAAPRSGERLTRMADQHVVTGERVAELLARQSRQEGAPDLVIGHIGWGGLMFARDVLPSTPLMGYCEFFYRAEGADVGFDPADRIEAGERMRLRLRNSAQLVTLDQLDAAFSPTRWQRSLYPDAYRERIGLCHDGIDVEGCRPDAQARFTLPNGRVLAPGDPVVTFVARDLEPYRGFPQFMRAAALVARERPDVTFVVAGGDGVSYGRPRADGRTWREAMMAESGLDPARVVFLGTIPKADLVRLFQVTTAHVYLSYPFVLSWSVLEAMACGALVVGSATPPVQEVISDGVNGLLAPFFDEVALAQVIARAIDRRRPSLQSLRLAARETILARFPLDGCLSRQITAIERLARGQVPDLRVAA
jgi:glycosyltransferase involved in cell wall biosynthesis